MLFFRLTPNGIESKYEMNYPSNMTVHPIGALVFHDADRKTERYLMVVDAYDTDDEGVLWMTTHYINPRLHREQGSFRNPMAFLHECERWLGYIKGTCGKNGGRR